MTNLTLGILGGNGWLGSALGRSILEAGAIAPEQLVVTTSRQAYRYSEWPAVTCVDSLEALAAVADVVVLSIRPEQFNQLVLAAGRLPLERHLVLSLMATVSMAGLTAATGSRRIVRAMPNIAATIGRSYTPWHASPAVTSDERGWIDRLLSTCGSTDELDDDTQIDYLTALTGSGPAFPALLAEAMIGHALQQGIPDAIARRSVLHNLAGSLQWMLDESTSPDEVVKRFLEYGGVTTDGLSASIAAGFRQAIDQGLSAAYARANQSPANSHSRHHS